MTYKDDSPLVVLQPKRILIREFYDDEALSTFLKYTRVLDYGMYFEVTKDWQACLEVVYNGIPYMAVPRRFSTDFIEDIVDLDNGEIVKDNWYTEGKTVSIKVEAEPRNEKQAEMLDFLLGDNSFSKLKKKPRRALFADTGTGKTFLTLKYIAETDAFAMINCPDNKAIKTWLDEILKFTDIAKEEIAIVQGRAKLKSVLKNKDKYKIVLMSGPTLGAMILKGEYDQVSAFFEEMQFTLTVHDEVHLNMLAVFFMELCTSTKKTLYLTATPGRRIYKEDKILASMLPNEACTFVEPPEARFQFIKGIYYSNPQDPKFNKTLNKPRGFDYLGYSSTYLLNDKQPYKQWYLDNIIRKAINGARKLLTKPTNKIAILGKTKLENTIIAEYITNHKDFKDLSIGVFNSDIEKMDERMLATDNQLIVSTDKSFNGIINIPDLEVIIIMHPISAQEYLLQICGRIRSEKGKKSIIIGLADHSFKRCAKAHANMVTTLEPRSLSVEDLIMNEQTVGLNPFGEG